MAPRRLPGSFGYYRHSATMNSTTVAVMHGEFIDDWGHSMPRFWDIDVIDLDTHRRTRCQVEGVGDPFFFHADQDNVPVAGLLIQGKRLWAWGDAFGERPACWDTDTGELLYRLVGHGTSSDQSVLSMVYDLQVHGDLVLTSGGDGTLRAWDVANGISRGTLLRLDGFKKYPVFRLVRAEGADITVFDVEKMQFRTWTLATEI